MSTLAANFQDQEGKGAGVATQAVPPSVPEPIPKPMPETEQPQDHLFTLRRCRGCGGKVVQESQSNGGKTQDQEKEGGYSLIQHIPPGDASSSRIPTDIPPGGAFSSYIPTDVPTGRLHDEEQAQVDRQRAELNRRRQQEVLDSAMYYTEADWINIMAQVEANASLSKTLLGDDVTKDN
ncbi:hypothetical protein Tco_0418603 [Tanacetum coccineum]